MAYIVIDNPFSMDKENNPADLPLKDNGAQWRHFTIFNGHKSMVLSDDLSGIISAHVAEYEDADFNKKEAVRNFLLSETIKSFNTAVSQEAEGLTNEQREQLLSPVPFGEGNREETPVWDSTLPLAINVGDYSAPGFPRPGFPRPEGENVLLLDSLTEERLIASMTRCGAIFPFKQ